MRIAGIVLAGGEPPDGDDKSALPFHDGSLLERAVATLASFASPIVVVRAADRRDARFPRTSAKRSTRGPTRPLEGLRAGLAALGDSADCAFVVAVDLPFLSAAFAQRVVALLGDHDAHDAAVPRTVDGVHPLAACYRVRVLPVIDRLLARIASRCTSCSRASTAASSTRRTCRMSARS